MLLTDQTIQQSSLSLHLKSFGMVDTNKSFFSVTRLPYDYYELLIIASFFLLTLVNSSIFLSLQQLFYCFIVHSLFCLRR